MSLFRRTVPPPVPEFPRAPEPLPAACLASPWRRLAACATDAALWLAAHLLLWLFYIPSEAELDSPTWFAHLNAYSVGLVWLYFWAGWAAGATPGQRMWGLRVVTLEGKRPGPLRALVRCAGYVLACIPLKVGLAMAWFHPRRQGLHDLLARTLVVHATAPRSFLPPDIAVKPAVKPAAPQLALGAARRGWPLVFAAYAVLAVVMTWPVAATLSTSAAGAGFLSDGGQFAWNYWFFRNALLHGQSLTSTDLLFYPNRVSLLFHTMNWFNCVLAAGLLQFFDLTVTYNLLFLFTFAACAFSAYWLCCAFTRDRAASFVAALPLSFAPYFLSHGLGHANLHSAQFLPLFALFFWAALASGRKRWAVCAGIALALNGLCDWQYLMFGGGLGLFLWAGFELFYASPPGERPRRARSALLAFAVGGVLLSPLLLPAVVMQRGNSSVDKSGQMGGFKADAKDFFAPNPFHPLMRTATGESQRGDSERFIAPGWTVLLLGIGGFWSVRRKLQPWLWVTGLFAIAACGPALTVDRDAPLPGAATLLLGGLPTVGFDFPWDNSQLLQVTQSTTARPDYLLRPTIGWMLPMQWIPRVVPPLRPFRVPARLAVVMLMGLSIGSAIGLARIRRVLRVGSGAASMKGRLAGGLAVGVAGGLCLLEYWGVPYPVQKVEWPAYYDAIRRDDSARAILEVPLQVNPAAMARQTLHGKAIFVGNLSRADDDAFRFVASNALIRRLSEHPFQWAGAPDGWKPQTSVVQGLAELRSIGTRYIIVDKSRTTGDDSRGFSRLLGDTLRLPVVFEDGSIRVYRL